MSDSTVFEIFPVNGLDRSLHAPVFAGLLIITFFAETLGWTFAGLVVPGYMASVIIAAPATAILVCVETLLTYGVCAALGRWLPRTQVWSTAFGRERFFLFILVALAVRLAVEANLLPWLRSQYELPHSRELNSLGLVLVPLLANMFWNAGFWRSLLRVGLMVGATYLFVEQVLLPHTNFTVSRFEIANESVSLAFLETPHAQLILLIGSLIAARANVLYGWDYNGILVPALLSVAWYQPTKLATTVIEAVVVYGAARALAAVPPLSRVLLVGTRRTLLVFTVGFLVKWVGGFGLLALDPGLQAIDFLGFGYLLPTLLAVKMWNRNAIGTVIVPTVQVSIVAFIVGNVTGYALSLFERPAMAHTPVADLPSGAHPTAFELMLGDTAADPDLASTEVGPRNRIALEAIERLSEGSTFDTELFHRASQLNVHMQTSDGTSGRHLTIRPISGDPDADRGTPRVAVRLDTNSARPLLVVAEARTRASPTIAAADAIAAVVDARALLVISTGRSAEPSDTAFGRDLMDSLGVKQVLRVGVGHANQLSVVGKLPSGLSLAELTNVVGADIDLNWAPLRSQDELSPSAARLTLTTEQAQSVGAGVLGAPATLHWPDGVGGSLSPRQQALTEVRPYAFSMPTVEQRRLLREGVLPAFLDLGGDATASDWQRSVAARLGYRYARITRGPDGPTRAWALIEPAGPHRRGNATWLRRAHGAKTKAAQAEIGLMIEAPAPRWEIGTFRAALMLFDGLGADALLIAGAPPNAAPAGMADLRRTSGRHSYYHTIHQGWVDRGRRAVVTHGIVAAHEPRADVVLSTGREVDARSSRRSWHGVIQEYFSASGFESTVFDGSLELAPFEGSFDPALAYSRRFAPDTTLLLWLSPAIRSRLVNVQEDGRTQQRLARAGISVARASVARRALELAQCASQDCPQLRVETRCGAQQSLEEFRSYSANRNPHALLQALGNAKMCHLEVLQDDDSGLLYALIADRKSVRIVPLRGGPLRAAPGRIRDLDGIRRLTSAGLATGVVELRP